MNLIFLLNLGVMLRPGGRWIDGKMGRLSTFVSMCLICLIAVDSGRSIQQIPPSPAAARLEKLRTRGKECCFIRNDFIQSWFQVSDLCIKHIKIYQIFEFVYCLVVRFILVQNPFSRRWSNLIFSRCIEITSFRIYGGDSKSDRALTAPEGRARQ